MVEVPPFPLVGVTVTVRVAPEPPRTMPVAGINVVLLEVAVSVSEAAGVTLSPTVNDNGPIVLPEVTVWFAIVVIIGALATVSTKLVAAVRLSPFFTVSVIVAVPVLDAAGVTVIVREAPDPPKTILAVGTSVVLLEAPVTVNEAAGVTLSPTVKANALVALPVHVVCFAIEVIVGVV